MTDSEEMRRAFENLPRFKYMEFEREEKYIHSHVQVLYEVFQAGAAWQAAQSGEPGAESTSVAQSATEQVQSGTELNVSQPGEVDEEVIIELLRPYLHFGTQGWRRVAEKAVEAIRPYLRTQQQPQPVSVGEDVVESLSYTIGQRFYVRLVHDIDDDEQRSDLAEECVSIAAELKRDIKDALTAIQKGTGHDK